MILYTYIYITCEGKLVSKIQSAKLYYETWVNSRQFQPVPTKFRVLKDEGNFNAYESLNGFISINIF